jgi:mannosyltransferase
VAWIAGTAPPSPWHQLVVEPWFRSDRVAQAVLALLVLGGIAAAARRRLPRRALAVAVPWALLPTAGLLAAGLVTVPLYWPRYVTFTAPAVALLAGLAVAGLPRLLGAVAVLLVAVLAVPQVVADRLPRAKDHSEMGLAAALVGAERRPSDGPSGIVFGQYDAIPGVTTRIEAIAYPGDFRGLADVRAVRPLADSTALFGSDISPTAAVARMRRLTTVWFLLDLDAAPRTVVPAGAMRAAGFEQTGGFRTPGSVLLRWSRVG